MEYYRKCNVCGKIECYTDNDLKENASNAMTSGLAALGSATSALFGTRYDMYELNKISESKKNKIVNYGKCSFCGSIDTMLVTKNYAKYSYKVKGNIEVDDLIFNAKKYLLVENYSDAFCFSSIALQDEPFNYDACLIRFLSSIEINKFEDLNYIAGDLFKLNYFQELYVCASDKQKRDLNEINVVCKDNDYIYNAEKLLKHPNAFSLIEIINKYIKKINTLNDDDKYNDLIKKLKTKKKRIIYETASDLYEEGNTDSLQKALRIVKNILMLVMKKY